MSEETKLYVLENLDKKSVYTREYWSDDDDNSFEVEEMYRWGKTILELTEEEAAEIRTAIENGDSVFASEYTIYDQDLQDGCSMCFEECVGTTVDELDKLWDNGGFSSFEEAGWNFDDCDVQYVGPCAFDVYEDTNGY